MDRVADQQLTECELRLAEAERQLSSANAQLRMALEAGRFGIWERDLATNAFFANADCKMILGLSPTAALTHEKLERMYHPGDAERIREAVSFALATKTSFSIEHRVIRQDGRIGRVLVKGSVVYEDDRAVRTVGIIQDMAERERAQEEVRRAQQRQEFLLKLNDQLRGMDDPYAIMEATAQALALFMKVDCAGYGEIDEDRQLVLVEREWSRGAISKEGRHYPLHDFLPTMFADLKAGRTLSFEDVQTDPRTRDPAVQARFTAMGERTVVVVPLLKHDRLTALLYMNAAQPRHWAIEDLTLVEDLAERTSIAVARARAEGALRESEARFRLIAESLPALVWIIDIDLNLTYANDRWLEFSGLPREKSLGDSWKYWVHPDDVIRVAGEMEHVRRAESAHTTELRYRAKDGTYRWHLVQAAPFYNARGEFKGWAGTSVDIHDIKETEQALRRSEEHLLIALRAAKMGDWSWHAATDRIRLSERAAEIFRVAPNEGMTWTDLRQAIHDDDLQRVMASRARSIETGDQYDVEYRIKRPQDGAFAWVAAQGQIIVGEDGNVSGMIGVVQDITDRKHAEERQQLLIRELHHRVKNTLATVQAIVGSTARTASSIDEFYHGFVGRIVSLAQTHDLLTDDLWQKASLEELLKTELGPYENRTRNRVMIEGPSVELPSEVAVPIGMAIHELTTNAVKHGALSVFGGQVGVRWSVEPGETKPRLSFTWSERGGPPVSAPIRQGFGSRLLQRVLSAQLQAEVRMDFKEHGLHFTMEMPIPNPTPIFNPDK